MDKTLLAPKEREALERLIEHAKRDSGQSAKVANFLLCWWNGTKQGLFDVRDVWAVDDEIAADMVNVFALMANHPNTYPDTLGYGDDFKHILRAHRDID